MQGLRTILTACDHDKEAERKDGCNTELLLHLHLKLENHGNGQTDDWWVLDGDNGYENLATHWQHQCRYLLEKC